MTTPKNHTKAITQKLSKLADMTSHSKQELYNHFIQIVFNMVADPSFVHRALPMGLLQVKPGWRVELPSYAANERAWNLLGEAGSDYLEAVKAAPPFTDILSEVCSEYAVQDLGQHLTPRGLAEGVGAFAMALTPPTAPISIGDPTGCGAGSLILSQLHHLYKHHGSEGIALANVTATDLDANMVKACCTQVMLSSLAYGLPLQSFTVRHGDAIQGIDENLTVYRFFNMQMGYALFMQKAAMQAAKDDLDGGEMSRKAA